jgi:hypothetical protein
LNLLFGQMYISERRRMGRRGRSTNKRRDRSIRWSGRIDRLAKGAHGLGFFSFFLPSVSFFALVVIHLPGLTSACSYTVCNKFIDKSSCSRQSREHYKESLPLQSIFRPNLSLFPVHLLPACPYIHTNDSPPSLLSLFLSVSWEAPLPPFTMSITGARTPESDLPPPSPAGRRGHTSHTSRRG